MHIFRIDDFGPRVYILPLHPYTNVGECQKLKAD